MSTKLEQHRELAKTTLAKNLSVARAAKGYTQVELAELSTVSRATIAQLEAGIGDPRLTTIIDLATALETSPILLLMGQEELNAVIHAHEGASILSDDEVDHMTRLVNTGLQKQLLQAGKLGATAAHTAGLSAVGGAIGTALLPGVGTLIGATLGAFFGNAKKDGEES